MSKTYRLLGLPNGAIDTKTNEIKFDLAVSGGNPISFTAKYGVMAQLLAGLGNMTSQLNDILDSAKGHQSVSAEQVEGYYIQKDKWSDVVLLQLMTPVGVPYTFALPAQTALDIADRLKSETSKVMDMGTA